MLFFENRSERIYLLLENNFGKYSNTNNPLLPRISFLGPSSSSYVSNRCWLITFPFPIESMNTISFTSQNTNAIILPTDCCVFPRFGMVPQALFTQMTADMIGFWSVVRKPCRVPGKVFFYEFTKRRDGKVVVRSK